MKAKVYMPSQEIEAFCRKWRIKEFSFFGSVLRDDFGPGSDIDVLVSFDAETNYGLFDLVHMEEELKGIFGREVDLVEKAAVERSRNYLRRKAILQEAEVVYAG